MLARVLLNGFCGNISAFTNLSAGLQGLARRRTSGRRRRAVAATSQITYYNAPYFHGERLHVYKDLQQPRKGSVVSVPRSMRQSLTGAGGAITSGIDPSARQTSKGFGLLITFDNIGSGSYAYGAGMLFASLRFTFCIRNPSTQEAHTLPIPAIRERKRIFYT